MAIKATLPTSYGEDRELYVRLNNYDTVSNHGVTAHARFRGFVSKEAFDERKEFVWEQVVEFEPDITQPLWSQAYGALRALDLSREEGAVSEIEVSLQAAHRRIIDAENEKARLEQLPAGFDRNKALEESDRAIAQGQDILGELSAALEQATKKLTEKAALRDVLAAAEDV